MCGERLQTPGSQLLGLGGSGVGDSTHFQAAPERPHLPPQGRTAPP